MRVIVVGLGVQGNKRLHFSGKDFVAAVDVVKKDKAIYQDITDVPLTSYDAALVCLPDAPKYKIIRYLLENNKHVLVEKPLHTETDEQILELQVLAQKKKLVCYTAYNHRFEPHFIQMKNLIDSGELGNIYSCRLFYGNGTARLVRNSIWRDQGLGVLTDLGSHLLDTIIFWFKHIPSLGFENIVVNTFENNAPDHVIVINKKSNPVLNLEMSLISWRNHFTCDIFAENGSAHIDSLCKWGPSRFIHRQRLLPSGRPPEETITLEQEDPTWAVEYLHFKNLIINGATTDLTTDLWIQQTLKRLDQSYYNSIKVLS